MSIRSYLVSKHSKALDWEKVVPPSMAAAVRLESSTHAIVTAKQSESSTQKKRSPYDKIMTTIQKAKIVRYAAEMAIQKTPYICEYFNTPG